MRVTGLIMPRAGWYVTLGLVFGMLAFMRSNAYRRRTGNSPWHIHPLVWGIVSVFVTFLVTLLSIVFVAIFGTVLSIYAWAPRSPVGPATAHEQTGTEYFALPGISLATGPAQAQAVTVLRAWLADPTGRHELRYFDGSGWTEHVADGGVISSDPS